MKSIFYFLSLLEANAETVISTRLENRINLKTLL